MIQSVLENFEVSISRLGFGAMRLPTLENGEINEKAATEMVDRAIAGGVNYFDTAYSYHNEKSEGFLGRALSRHPRDSYFLADKLPTWLLREPGDPDRIFDEQLRRCGVDRFDFYLLHNLNAPFWANVQKTDAHRRLLERQEKGQIRFLGFSFHGDYPIFRELLDFYPWDFVQIQTNYLDYELQQSKLLHQELNERGIPCFVMEPVRGGLLANPPGPAKEILTGANAAASCAEWALRWCMDLENTPVILSGMSSMEQLEQNLATFSAEKPLTAGEREAVERARKAILSREPIPCTFCGYCSDCPVGVNISRVFMAYNSYKLQDDMQQARTIYRNIGEERQADKCARCGACAPRCPQGIDIPERLAHVHKMIAG